MFKAFSRGLGYHVGAGIGQAIRAVVYIGGVAVAYKAYETLSDDTKRAELKYQIQTTKTNVKRWFKRKLS